MIPTAIISLHKLQVTTSMAMVSLLLCLSMFILSSNFGCQCDKSIATVDSTYGRNSTTQQLGPIPVGTPQQRLSR